MERVHNLKLIGGPVVLTVLICTGIFLYTQADYQRFVEELGERTEVAPTPISPQEKPTTQPPKATETSTTLAAQAAVELTSEQSHAPTRLAIDTEGPVDTAVLIPEETGDFPVSPYGFGPYPELPEEWAGAFPPNSVKHELIVRVAVKLREQGVNVEGTSMEEGRVYPHIRGIYYVKWAETDEGVRYIANGTGHPYDGNRLHAIRVEKEEPLTEADIPADIKLVSYEEGGIDPYEFLGLHR